MIRNRKNNKSENKPRQRQISDRADYESRRYLYHSFDVTRTRNVELRDEKVTEIQIDKNKNNFFKYWITRIIKLIIVSLLIVGFIRFSQLSNKVTVSSVNQSLNTTYATVIDNFLSKSIFNKNKLTINSTKLVQYLKNKYPDISDVKVSFGLFNQNINVKIIMSQTNIFLSTTFNAGLVDDQGRVIETNILTQKGYTIVNYPVNLKLSIGNQVLTPSQINFIQTVLYQLNNKRISINHFNILPGADELDAYIQGKPYYIKFNLNSNDSIQQSGTFLALSHYLTINNIIPSQYIDVRIDGRAYFK